MLGLALIVVLVAACSPAAAPTGSVQGSPGTAPATQASSRSAPAGDAADAPVSASVERDGVRLTLEIEHAQLSINAPSWASMTVENLGPDAVVYGVGGCGLIADVSGWIVGDWTGGLPQVGSAGAFKAVALSRGGSAGSGALGVGFVPESMVGNENAGCADLLQLERLEAGATEARRALWRGDGSALVPSDTLELVARFPFFRRESDPADREGPPIDVTLSVAVRDASPSPLIGPGRAIDAALGNPAFARFVASYPQAQWINPMLDLDTERAIWTVGLFVDRGPPDYEQYGSVRIAATTGLVVDVRFDPPLP